MPVETTTQFQNDLLIKSIPAGAQIRFSDVKGEVLFSGEFNRIIFENFILRFAKGYYFVEVLDADGKIASTNVLNL